MTWNLGTKEKHINFLFPFQKRKKTLNKLYLKKLTQLSNLGKRVDIFFMLNREQLRDMIRLKSTEKQFTCNVTFK